MKKSWIRFMGIALAALMVLGVVSSALLQIVGFLEEEIQHLPEVFYSNDSVVSCYLDGGMLSVNITDPGLYEWRYYPENSTAILQDELSDFDGYHFAVGASEGSDSGYAVVAEYDTETEAEAEPHSYGIVKFSQKSGNVTEINEVVHVSDLSEYNF